MVQTIATSETEHVTEKITYKEFLTPAQGIGRRSKVRTAGLISECSSPSRKPKQN